MSRSGSAGTHRRKEGNRPPQDEPWIWLTLQMLESPAWRAMTLSARKVVERIAIEHMAHAGRCNGELVVTYDDFVRYGIRRSSIIEAIAIATALGWIDTIRKGYLFGQAKVPSQYALTILPRCDGTPATNRWKGIGEEDAKRMVATCRQKDWRPKRRQGAPSTSRDIRRSRKSETGAVLQFPGIHQSQKCDLVESQK